MKDFRALLALAFAALAFPAAAALSIHGEVALGPKSVAVANLKLGHAGGPDIVLSPVSDSELATVRHANLSLAKRTSIGIERSPEARAALATMPALVWHSVSGGYAAQASVTSPDAGALRVAIDLKGVAENVTLVFYGSADPSRLEGPVRVGDLPDRTAPWWGPVTDGDTQTVEFFSPGSVDAANAPRLVNASHLFTTLASRFTKWTTDVNHSGPCNVDIQCSPLKTNPGQAFLNMRNAVAQMLFQSNGQSFLCTGQLLNDTDASSQLPWFFSANHCFDNESPPFKTPAQMQTVASSLSTLWFFEAQTCNVDVAPSNYVQLNGGAVYIYNNQPADVLFIRLNNTPPAGAFFAGWNSNALPVGSQIVVVHHPSGDLKKVSQGSVVADSTAPLPGNGSNTTLFNEVKYTSGTTEGGSSGSGLYTFDGSQYQLRGALFGGGAACDAINDSDWYSQFDKVFSSLAPYLAPAGSTIDYSDLWWNANESGMGLNIVQHASRNIFAVWFVYGPDGKPTWYTIPGGTWTATTTFAGDVYATTGPPASSGTFDPSSVAVRKAGNATIVFSDANNASFSYIIDGTAGSKSITRQPY